MKRQLTHAIEAQERKDRKRRNRAWQLLVGASPPEVPMKTVQRGRFAENFPTLEGRGVQTTHPRIVNISFDVTQEVAAALRTLRDTGLFGNGVDCASVAEELLRHTLRQPDVLEHWRPVKVPHRRGA